jgi:PAS domain S-box-containing protein
VSDRVSDLEAEVKLLKEERDELRAALAHAERYRRAIEEAPFGVMCSSHENGQYVFSNPAHAGFLGYTPEEIVASDPHQRWVQITHPEDFERESAEFRRLAAGEIPSYESERRCIRKDGQVRWARVKVVGVRDAAGRLAHIYVYFMDVNEHHIAIEARERAEAQLRQAQKLEALGRLAGGVAHDFNNRLVIIMGYAEMLKNGVPPDSPAAQQAETIVTSAKRAAELTRQLLAYSRRQVLKPQAFDLNETVDRMRRLLERLIGEDIELVTVLGAKYPVFSDAGQIEQVILNLAINARDAMPAGGRLTLETRDLVLGGTPDATPPPGDYVALVVSDTGTGIPEEVLPRIFEPFFTTKEVGRGTGLGLATVEGIVRQSGGVVRVESRQDEGSTFTVYLPRARVAPAVSPSLRAAHVQPLRFETVLVCDDDDAVRSLVVEVLRLRAYDVLEARNGQHALEVARAYEGDIELLITDLVMPELNGTALARELKRRRPGLRVLFISGYTDDEAVLSSSLGPDAQFLAKPFLPGELVRAVRAILTGPSSSESKEVRA